MPENVLTKLVYAWREAKKISDGMEKAFGTALDAMYDIHGNILDALREYAFEEGDLDDSQILTLLLSETPAYEIARMIQSIHDVHMINSSPMVKQPAPKFFTDEQIAIMQATFGGYTYDAK